MTTSNAAFEPLVSVVIPVFNGSAYVGEAIESALGQDYPKVEVIVVDDGSSDDGATARVVQQYASKVTFLSKPNGGVATALNLAIQSSAGEYISWLSHDDRYLPNKISAQIEYLQSAQAFDAVLFSDYYFIDANGARTNEMKLTPPEPKFFQEYITQVNNLHGCTLLIPRACFEQVGFFDEQLRTTQDYMLWFDIAEEFEFRHLPVTLIESRLHDAQGTRTLANVAYAECNDLCSLFLDRVVESGRHHGNAFEFCAASAKTFKARGYKHAYKHARHRAKEQLRSLRGMALFRGLLAYRKLRPAKV